MKTPIALILTASVLCAAPPREWRSRSGDKSLRGYFVKRDQKNLVVTLTSNARQHTIPISQLHPDDRLWLDKNYPVAESKRAEPEEATNGVLENIGFGDTRDEVTQKLLASRMFESTMDQTFFGRMGLNGIFKSTETIGGLHGYLFFDWDEDGGLESITLQTEPQEIGRWKTHLEPCMEEFVKLISALHGKAAAATHRTNPASLDDGMFMGDYLWRLEPVGSILLGPSRMDGKIHISVRFTKETIGEGR